MSTQRGDLIKSLTDEVSETRPSREYRNQFPLFQSHIDLAHLYWQKLVFPGSLVIDATCGNGRDTLELCRLALANASGKVFAIDIQADAIANTKQLLASNLTAEQFKKVYLFESSHQSFPEEIEAGSVQLITYNLGYLPGGNKAITTMTNSTIASLDSARLLLAEGGVVCITCYPGHPEGQNEETSLKLYCQQLTNHTWSCCWHTWLNRKQAPSLLLIQKKKDEAV